MDKKQIAEYISIMEKHLLTVFEYKKGDESIRLEKAPSVSYSSAVSAAAPANNQGAEAPKTAQTENAACNTVKSPIVGTFYASPSPDAKPFVTVGQTVKKGDVLCIVEAMKMMNDIESEFDGKVKEVLVLNGALVEFSQPLFIIE